MILISEFLFHKIKDLYAIYISDYISDLYLVYDEIKNINSKDIKFILSCKIYLFLKFILSCKIYCMILPRNSKLLRMKDHEKFAASLYDDRTTLANE